MIEGNIEISLKGVLLFRLQKTEKLEHNYVTEIHTLVLRINFPLIRWGPFKICLGLQIRECRAHGDTSSVLKTSAENTANIVHTLIF